MATCGHGLQRSSIYLYWSRPPVCLSVPRRIPTLLHGPGCNFGKWYGVPASCALLCGFAIGARVSLLLQHSAERQMSASVVLALCPVYIYTHIYIYIYILISIYTGITNSYSYLYLYQLIANASPYLCALKLRKNNKKDKKSSQ